MYDKFFTDLFTEEEADVIVIGVPNGTGGKEYVDSLRKQSWFVEIFDIYRKRNLFDKKVCDVGDITDHKNLDKKLTEIFLKRKVPIIITKGDIASYRACNILKNVKVVSFDAHTDLLDRYTDPKIESIDGFRNERENSSTWLRRTVEVVGADSVCVIGLRSVDEDTMAYMEKSKILHITPREIEDDMEGVKDQMAIFTQGEKIWVNLDVDCFDPSIAPNVDYSEPEGMTFRQFCDIVSSFKGRIAGVTLCGGNPMQGNVTEFLSVRSLFELMSKI